MRKFIIIAFILTTIIIISVGHFYWNERLVEVTDDASTVLEKEGYVKKSEHSGLQPKKVGSNTSETTGTNGINSENDDGQTADSATDKQEKSSNSKDSTNKKKSAKDQLDSEESTSKESSDEDSNGDTTIDSSGTKSLDVLKQQYSSVFNELEAQETSKIDQLMVEAKAEYVSNKSSKISILSKYQEAATLLEQNADQSFNILYQNLQYDLEKNGYDVSEAEEYKTIYNQKKQDRSIRIINQIKDF